MVMTRTRLSRSGSSMKGNGRLRRQIASELQGMPTERVKKYATLSKNVTAGNPVLAETKQAAELEIKSRAGQLAVWQKGRAALTPKPPIKFREGIKKFLQFAGKAANVYGKALSGEWQEELQETIATAGMKPKEKKAVAAKMHKEWEKGAEMEPIFPAEVPYEDFSVTNSAKLIQKEMKDAKKEAFT